MQSQSVLDDSLELETMPLPEPEPLLPPAGEILRKAREERGETLSDIARTLKLSANQLEALENGRYDILPGPTFVRGFLRNYANYLGVPPDPLLAGISARTPTAADLASMIKLDGNVQPAASPRPQSKALPVVLIILAVALVLAGLAWAGVHFRWFNGVRFGSLATASAHEKSAAVVPIQEKRPVVVPVVEKQSVVAVVAEKQPVAAAEEQPVTAAGKTVRLEPQIIRLAQPVPVNIAPELENAPLLGSGEQTIAPDQAQAGPPLPDVATLRVLFSASTLAQVRDNSGKLIFTRTGTKGSSSSIKGKPPLTVMVKQANHVKLEFNGQSVDLKGHTNKDGIARLTLQ